MEVRNYIRNSWKFSIRTKNKLGNSITVPYKYSSPCAEGLFDELYYWDTYFLNRGLLNDKEYEQAKNNILDISYLISTYGFMPNAARFDMLTRSQPPFFISMVIDYYNATHEEEILTKTINSMNKEMEFWVNKRSININGTLLFQYRSDATDELYANFAKEYKDRVKELVDENESLVQIGKNALAECESGWDFSSRFNQRILNFIPIDLNSMMYFNLSELDKLNKKYHIKSTFDFKNISEKIKIFLTEKTIKDGIYFDYDFKNDKLSETISMASFFVFKFGISNDKKMFDILYQKLYKKYGLSTTEKENVINYQWGYPNIWPNLVLVAFDGAKNIKYFTKCIEIARFFTNLVENEFKISHKLWEKYDALVGSKSRKNEYAETEMLGWTAGTYVVLFDYLKEIDDGKNNG